MSNKERCIAILDTFTESQLANIAVMLQAAQEAVEDAFCVALYMTVIKMTPTRETLPASKMPQGRWELNYEDPDRQAC